MSLHVGSKIAAPRLSVALKDGEHSNKPYCKPGTILQGDKREKKKGEKKREEGKEKKGGERKRGNLKDVQNCSSLALTPTRTNANNGVCK